MAWLLIVLVLLPSFAAFSLMVTGVFFERDWRSKSVVAKSHGRSDVVILSTQLLTVVLFTLQDSVNVWVLRVAVLVAGILVFAAVMHTLPFHKAAMNAYRASTAAIFLWASVTANMKALLPQPEIAAYTFWLGLPVVIVAASQSVYLQLARFESPTIACKNSYHSEIRVRVLHEMGIAQQDMAQRLKRETKSTNFIGGQSLSTKVGEPDDEGQHSVDIRISAMVEAVYLRSIETMANSSILYLFYAQYLHSLGGGKHRQKESLMLNKAEQKSPAFDVSFLIWQRRKQMEEDDTAAEQGHMNVLTRVAFDKHMKDALNSGALARKHLVLFWTELKSKLPDLGRLYELGGTLNESIAKTESAFGSLLNINRRNVDVLRKYAGFVADVLNHPSRAQVLLDEAATIEERSTKLTKLRHSNFDFGARTDASQFPADLEAGVYTMAHMGANAGRLVAVNAAASRQSGFSESDILGREAGILLPPPFDKWFNTVTFEALGDGHGGDGTYLDQFSDQDAWYFMLMLNAQMFLIPVAISTRWNADGINALTYRVNSSKGFMILSTQPRHTSDSETDQGMSGEASLAMLSCCAKSLELTGLADFSASGPNSTSQDVFPLQVQAMFPGLTSQVFAHLDHQPRGVADDASNATKMFEVEKVASKLSQRVIPGTFLPMSGSRTPSAASPHRKAKTIEADVHLVRCESDAALTLVVSWNTSRDSVGKAKPRLSHKSLSKLNILAAVSEDKTSPRAVHPVSPFAAPANGFQRAQTLPTGALEHGGTEKSDASGPDRLALPPVSLNPALSDPEGAISNSVFRTNSIRLESASEADNKSGPYQRFDKSEMAMRELTTNSVAAESDGGSTSSGKSSFSTLRRLLTQRNKQIDPKLRLLRSAFFYIFIFAAVAFVTNTVLIDVVGKSATDALVLARRTAQRLEIMQAIAINCQILAISRIGGIAFDQAAVQLILSELNAQADSLTASGSQLYEQHSSSLSSEDHAVYYHENDAVELMYVSVYAAETPEALASQPSTTRRMSLLGATAAFASALKVLANSNSSMYQPEHPLFMQEHGATLQALYTVLYSSDSLYAAMNATHAAQLEVAHDSVSTLMEIPAESVLICAIIFDILMVSLIAPTIQSLEQTKDNVLKTFLFLPRKLVLRVHLESSKKLIRAQKEARDDNGSSDESVDDVELAFKQHEDKLEQSNETAARQLSLARTSSKLHIMQQKSTLWDAVQVRRHTKSLRVFLVLMTRFSAPILLLLVYLAASYAYQRFEMGNLRYVTDQMEKSDARILEAGSLASGITVAIHPNRALFPDFVSGNFTVQNMTQFDDEMLHVQTSLERMQRSSKDLLFGNEVTGLRPSVITAFSNTASLSAAYVSMAQRMADHFLSNGCAASSSPAVCSNILQGSFAQGVSFGLNRLQEESSDLLSVYRAALNDPKVSDQKIREKGQELLKSHPGRQVQTPVPGVVTEALQYASKLYVDMMQASLGSFVRTMNAVTAMVVVALFLFYALLYRPSIRQVDKDIARTTGMLLMLPIDAVSKSPVVNEMISSAVKSLKQTVSQGLQ